MFDGLRRLGGVIRHPIRAWRAPLARSTDGETIFWSDFWSREKGYGYSSNELLAADAVRKVGAVYRCMLTSASMLAAVPLVPYRGKRRLEAGPEFELLKRANNLMRGDDLIEMIVMQLVGLRGCAFVMLDDIDSKGPHAMKAVPPTLVTADRSKYDPYDLRGWMVRRAEGGQDYVEPEQMIFIKYDQDPNGDPLSAIGPLEVAAIAAKADYAAARHNQNLFRANTPPALLRNKGQKKLDKQQKQELTNQFAEECLPGQFKFVDADIEVQELSAKIKDMEYVTGREWNRAEICSIWNVDPFFLGVEMAGGLSDAGTKVRFRKQYQVNAIPLGRKIERAFTDGLQPWFGEDFTVAFDWDVVEALRDDLKDKLEIALKFKELGTPYNETGDVLDLGTKKLPWGDETFVSYNNTTAQAVVDAAELDIAVARVTETIPAPEPGAPAGGPPPALIEPPNQLPAPSVPGEAEQAVAQTVDATAAALTANVLNGPQMRLRLWRAHVNRLTPVENRIVGKVKAVLNKQRVAVLHALENGQRALKRDKPSKSSIDDAKNAVDEEAIATAVKPYLMQGYRIAAEDMNTDLHKIGVADDSAVKVAAGRIPKLASSYYDARLGELVNIGQRVKAAVGQTLTEGFKNGENLSDLKDRVRQTFNASASRARTIARTESNIAMNTGRVEMMKTQGVEELEWLSAGDELVRESHQIDGETIDIGETFSNDLEYPGQSDGPPEEVINCFLPGTMIGGAIVNGLKARYAGPARQIITAQGHRLRVTANHPVLTSRGFLPASALREGDQLVAYCRDVNLAPAHNNHSEMPVEHVFDALRGKETIRQARTMDFHGDGRFIKGEIHIVMPYGRLLRDGEIPTAQEASEFALIAANATSGRQMGSPHLSFASALRHSRPLEPLRIGRIATLDVALPETNVDRRTGKVELLRKGVDTHAVVEQANDFVDVDISTPAMLRAVAGGDDATMQAAGTDAEFIRQLLDRFAGLVAFDEVVDVLDFDYTGHVYDLQSVTGYVAASGVICKQCRCTVLPHIGQGG